MNPNAAFQMNVKQPVGTGPATTYANGSTITSDMLKPAVNTPFQTPQVIPAYPVSTLNTGTPAPVDNFQMTQPEVQADSMSTKLQQLNERLVGQSAFKAQQETALGIPELQKTQNDLTSQLNAIKNEALSLPIQYQEGIKGGNVEEAMRLKPILQDNIRANAIKALSVNSLLEASRGNLTSALDMVDRAVAQQFDPIKEQIAVTQANLDLILKSPAYSLAEKKRAAAQQKQQAAEERAIAQQEQDKKDVYNTALTALKYGAPASLVAKAQQAGSPLEAAGILSQYLQDPKAKYELESARLDNVLKQQQIKRTNAEIAQIGQPTRAQQEASTEAIEKAKAQIPVAYDKLNLITSLVNSPGLNGAVGPNSFARMSPFSTFTGAKQNFIGGVEQLVSQEFLGAVLGIKAQGATLGALNEQEGNNLRTSATKIANWALKDESGNVIGYNVSEADMKKELEQIQTLTQRALIKAGEKLITKDEKSALDAVWAQPALTSTQATLTNPEVYFTNSSVR